MNPIQWYLGPIERLNLLSIITVFITIYFIFGLTFAVIYYSLNLIDNIESFIDVVYFSFITQTTVGYGDINPIGWGRPLTVIQTIIGLLLFAIGTGAVVLRMLTPYKNAINFDEYLIFYPKECKFRFRILNRLPIDIHGMNIEMRLRHMRMTASGTSKRSRTTVSLMRSYITILPSLRPLFVSTDFVKLKQEPPQLLLGKEIQLHPGHLSNDTEIMIMAHAQHFAGNLVTTKVYDFSFIICGEFNNTYEGDQPVNWDNWNKHTLTNSNYCEICNFEPSCSLKNKLLGKVK